MLGRHLLAARGALGARGVATEATFDWNPYRWPQASIPGPNPLPRLHKLDEGPATSATLTREEGLRLYKEMVTVRWVLVEVGWSRHWFGNWSLTPRPS